MINAQNPPGPTRSASAAATYEVGGPRPLPAADPGAPADIRAARDRRGPVAVFVTHGMGEQIPFQTLDLVAGGLRREDALRRDTREEDLPAPRARSVAIDGERLQRAELRLHRADGTEQEVHVYEGYWAPLTEGQVGLKDVVAFLFRGASNGIWNAVRKKGFRRWLFDQYPWFPVPASTLLMLGVAATVILGLVALNAAVALVAVGRSPLNESPHWLSESLFSDLTTLMNLFLTLALFFALSLLAVRGLRRGPRGLRASAGALSILAFSLLLGGTSLAGLSLPILFAAHIRCAPADAGVGVLTHALGSRFVQGFDDAFSSGALGLIAGAGAALILVAAWKLLAGAAQEMRAGGRRLLAYALGLFGVAVVVACLLGEIRAAAGLCREAATLPMVRRGVSWLLLVAISAWVRSLLVQYPGDVAAYVDSHSLDKFHALRAEIKETVWKRARAVYSAAGEGGSPFLYAGCTMVGHSLGSVIAYDTLNRLIQEDEAAPGGGAVAVPRLDVVARTPLFLTFGSPLDKTAFVFGVAGRNTTEAREAIAASVQPMICGYGFRPRRWINLYSSWDIVSGSIDLYDPPGSTDPRRVENLSDPDATTLLAAHLEYWKNPLLFEILHRELTAIPVP